MAYIGNTAASRFVSNRAASVFSGDGSAVAFTLEQVVTQDEDILVSVDGVVQEPSVAYAVSSGTTLTFTAAPSTNSGNNIFVYYLASQAGTVGHPSTQALSATSGTFSTTLASTGNATVGGTLGVTGASTLSSTLGVTGAISGFSLAGRKLITTNFNTASAVTASLTVAESGATVLINGAANNVINLPAASTSNPGLYYDFIIMTAVAGDKTTIINIAGSGGNFVGAIHLAVTNDTPSALNIVLDNAGDALTFVNATVVGSRARITCLTDDGTNGVWEVEVKSKPVATIA